MKHCWHWAYFMPGLESSHERCCFCGIERYTKHTFEEKPVEGHGEHVTESVSRSGPPSIPDDAECPARKGDPYAEAWAAAKARDKYYDTSHNPLMI